MFGCLFLGGESLNRQILDTRIGIQPNDNANCVLGNELPFVSFSRKDNLVVPALDGEPVFSESV